MSKKKHGRPTKYREEYIAVMKDYFKEAIPENMQIPTVEGFALRIGVSKQTLYTWGEKYPSFLDALEELQARQKEALTTIGIFGGKEINASIVKLFLSANHGMAERSDITSGGDKVQAPTVYLPKEDDN